ncbi:hypothetical protein, partial [Salmonella sp. SAL4449]|uniref:hypothetical protein n=1 Tax=Salmonella sp. SAL4449 TaxID=3159904 RepID=UPI00397C719F
TGPQYAAILDNKGNVLLHSDPKHIGDQLGRLWYEEKIREYVVETKSKALTNGETAVDVRQPISVGGREVGEYHTGFNVKWLN